MLEKLETEYIGKLLQFTQEVKESLRTPGTGGSVFGKAVHFLAQPPPEIFGPESETVTPEILPEKFISSTNVTTALTPNPSNLTAGQMSSFGNVTGTPISPLGAVTVAPISPLGNVAAASSSPLGTVAVTSVLPSWNVMAAPTPLIANPTSTTTSSPMNSSPPSAPPPVTRPASPTSRDAPTASSRLPPLPVLAAPETPTTDVRSSLSSSSSSPSSSSSSPPPIPPRPQRNVTPSTALPTTRFVIPRPQPRPSKTPASTTRAKLLQFSEKTRFNVKCPRDRHEPCIIDLKILSNGLILLADYENKCVKLFTQKGMHISSLDLGENPRGVAVMHPSYAKSDGVHVAVTLPGNNSIVILNVTSMGCTKGITITTRNPYRAISAWTDPTSLVVGNLGGAGVDLQSSSKSRYFRPINYQLHPCHMSPSELIHVVMATQQGTIAKVNVTNKDVVFERKVPQVEDPSSVTVLPSGEILVADCLSRSLHLLRRDGRWLSLLWRHPAGGQCEDQLSSVSCDGEICVTCTWHGPAYILRCD
ncbi:hypothetical protein ElyMa_003168900 [Elysia marginata]|uniref:Uncharacterized protein n=1 Tax=Elysia marginata TaxID=1093978 RepID=A0AAV4IVX0_9GAST|nr:hypothetical protein ElyMa_003168900 [Elysia marginata]